MDLEDLSKGGRRVVNILVYRPSVDRYRHWGDGGFKEISTKHPRIRLTSSLVP